MKTLRSAHWGLKLGLLVVQVELGGLVIAGAAWAGLLNTPELVNLANMGELIFFVLWALILFL